MSGMPKGSKHEWRHKGGGGVSVAFCPDFGFCPMGSCSAGRLLSGGLFCPTTLPSTPGVLRKN